jgi:hypothetical protein
MVMRFSTGYTVMQKIARYAFGVDHFEMGTGGRPSTAVHDWEANSEGFRRPQRIRIVGCLIQLA